MLPSDGRVGFLLGFKYSHQSTALKGADAVFYDILQQCGLYKSLELVPVLVHTYGSGGYERGSDDLHIRNLTR